VKTALLRVGISNFDALLQLLSDTAFANKSSASRSVPLDFLLQGTL